MNYIGKRKINTARIQVILYARTRISDTIPSRTNVIPRIAFKSSFDHSQSMVDSVDNIVRKYVLVNATEHEGIAQPKSVLGKILG